MTYIVKISWEKDSDENFMANKYSRAHTWVFDGGIKIAASSSPHVVPVPMSLEQAVDPEEAFIAALSSCHMLWFLSIAAGRRLIVQRYEDQSQGILGRNRDGKTAMTRVTLNPRVVFGGETLPSRAEIEELHHLAHGKCFIANSVKTEIIIAPLWDRQDA